MRIYRDLTQPRRRLPGLVIGIGNFDGVHRGHLKVIAGIKRRAGKRGTAGLLTFDPHPRQVMKKGEGANLSTLGQKLDLLRKTGIQVCWVIDFSRQLSRQAPARFIREVLVNQLGVMGVCVGEGFRFGRARQGNLAFLKAEGRKLGFRVEEVSTLRVNGRRLSSSWIRSLLRRGDLARAARCLGRDYSLSGRVIRGLRLGRFLGYPTANFYPEQLAPRPGVYAARIELGGKLHSGITYIGIRPTLLAGYQSPLLAEAYIFGYRRDLYGRRIKVFLIKRIRGDIKFKDLFALKRRIRRDEQRVRLLLRKAKKLPRHKRTKE